MLHIDWAAVLASALYFSFAIVALDVFLGRGKDPGSTFWVIIFLPMVLYLVFSGQIAKLSGGGFAIELNKKAETPIKDIANSIAANEVQLSTSIFDNEVDPAVFWEIPTEILVLKVAKNDDNIILNGSNYYKTIQKMGKIGYLLQLSILQNELLGLVVLDEENHVAGVFTKEWFYDLLRIEFTNTFIFRPDTDKAKIELSPDEQIQNTNLAALILNPLVRSEREGRKYYLYYKTKLLEALQILLDGEWDFAVLTDSEGKYNGVVSRRALESAIFTSFVKALSSE